MVLIPELSSEIYHEARGIAERSDMTTDEVLGKMVTLASLLDQEKQTPDIE